MPGKVEQSQIRLEDFFKEIAYGEVRLKVADGKPVTIPEQVIERPKKAGVHMHIVVHEPICLRQY